VSKGNSDDIVSGSFDRTDADKISAKVPINSASKGRSLATRRCNQIVHALTTLFVDASKGSKVQTPISGKIPTDNER